MDVVTFYHDDNSLSYDQQSSPSSVGSASSADIGAVSAIALPNQGGYPSKEVMLKSMNLNLSPHLNNKTSMGHISENSVISEHNINTSACNTSINNGQSYPHHQGVITSAYSALNASNVLTSPDVNMLKLNSPDLERFIHNNPNNNGQFMYHKSGNQTITSVTQEQELYADGFVRELERIKSVHGGSNPDISSPAMSGVMGSEASQCSVITSGQSMGMPNEQYSMQESYYPQQHPSITTSATGLHGMGQGVIGTIHHTGMPQNRDILRLKEEPPQTVPEVNSNTPPHSPIDMEHQERIKSERKRQRNRVAASKCRKRKLERISRLEDKVKQLKSHNMELTSNANVLRQQVAELKSKVMAHVNSGCKLMMTQQHQANF